MNFELFCYLFHDEIGGIFIQMFFELSGGDTCNTPERIDKYRIGVEAHFGGEHLQREFVSVVTGV